MVFPNPVPPGYTGSIGIRGLVNNAIVKITELDGRLVCQTRAFGGQAMGWQDYKGRKISTGVYLVLVSDDGSTNRKNVTKIVFITNNMSDKLHNTKGIVLRTVKYGETSVIVSIFTELFGVQSYLVNGVRASTKKGSGKANLFQPSAILDMVVYHSDQ